MPNTWPGGLPQDAFVGYAGVDEPNWVESDNASGPPKRRRRTTRVRRSMTVPVEFTGLQLSVFQTFFRDTLLDGTLEFDWTDPFDVNDSSVGTVSFRFTEPPQFQNASPAPDPSKRLFRGQLKLEVL